MTKIKPGKGRSGTQPRLYDPKYVKKTPIGN